MNPRRPRPRPWLLLLLPGLASCSGGEADRGLLPAAHAAAPAHKSVKIGKVPHVRQLPDFCGEACAEMALARLGLRVSQTQFFDLAGVDPALGRGAVTREMVRGLKRVGFEPGRVWYPVERAKAAAGLRAQFSLLHKDLLAGHPSIICTRYDGSRGASEHFRLVLGYDARRDEVLYHEPAEAGGAYRRMKRAKLLSLWPLKYRRDRWTVIRMRLKPGKLTPPRPALPGAVTKARLVMAVRDLKRTLPAGFTLVVEPPFIVVGDDDPEMVHMFARSTVRWTVTRLKRAYFSRDPLKVLTIWLLKDAPSYEATTRRLFGRAPGTPYGFYSSDKGVMVMNIATGGGTLVHEIVHPFVESNFPACPAWFNEGLGSLYEQSTTCGQEICGLTNWRLRGLQGAIRAGRVPAFATLTSTSTVQFYDQDPGTNYAQARYLLYYLQEKKLLRRYYHRFRRDQAKDPTGYRTLQAVLGEKDMAAFQARWQRWVLKLRFR